MAQKRYDVRRLNTGDLFKVTQILSVISHDLRDALTDIENTDQQALGFMIIESGMKHAETHLKELLADVAGLSIEEFENEPFDAPIVILEEIQEKEDLRGFLERARTLMSKFSGKS